ncbi:MAG: sigma 54-interacting transcriptional regulator, partial [Calditrichaeota bacterium]|nr:sigma 54-interacting transcriptional regulator [Calditrichota bacterium]
MVTGKPSSIRQDVHASELLTMINSITDGVMAIRLDRKVTFFNRAAIEITGFSEQEALGTPCYEIFGLKPEDCVLVRTLESQKPILNHYADITIANGRRIQISVSTSVLRDEDGKISGAIETFRDMSLVEALRKELQSSYSFEDIIGHSKPMREIFKLLPIISNSDSSVLIEGESGTGKELVARALHNLSPRKGKPLVTVNCAAIPSTLLESELFGYKAGAFTGAKKDKSGRFSLADGGTLFLDEIGEIEPNIQVKLLRAIQEKEFEPLGSTKTEKADIRLISATNKNLSEDARTGKFRQDLFYRIKVVSLMIEPLRNRMEDVPVLVNYFISKFNKLFNKN